MTEKKSQRKRLWGLMIVGLALASGAYWSQRHWLHQTTSADATQRETDLSLGSFILNLQQQNPGQICWLGFFAETTPQRVTASLPNLTDRWTLQKHSRVIDARSAPENIKHCVEDSALVVLHFPFSTSSGFSSEAQDLIKFYAERLSTNTWSGLSRLSVYFRYSEGRTISLHTKIKDFQDLRNHSPQSQSLPKERSENSEKSSK